MKFPIIIVVFSFIYSSVFVSAQQFKGPLEDVLKQKLNLSLEQFRNKCQGKTKDIVDRVVRDRDTARKIGTALANDVLYRVTISENADEHTWNRVVTNRCGTNEAVRVLNHLDVDEINLCLDDNEKLSGVRKIDFEQTLLKGFCAAVKKLAKEKYAAQTTK